jgi:diaminopimelate epimerase
MNPAFEVIGPVLECQAAFPRKINVEFVEIVSRNHLKVKVWERGAGPTLACGTGACATVVAGVLTNKVDGNSKVSLPGGDLFIHWNKESNRVEMTGPAKEVFRGRALVQ